MAIKYHVNLGNSFGLDVTAENTDDALEQFAKQLGFKSFEDAKKKAPAFNGVPMISEVPDSQD